MKKPYQFPVIKPERPKQETTYGLVAEAGWDMNDGNLAFKKTIDCIQKWLDEKVPYNLPPHSIQRKSYTIEEGFHRVECVSLLEKGVWAARLSHPDVGMGKDIPAVAGRHWTTDTCAELIDGRVQVAIRIACHSAPNCNADIKYVRPGLVRRLNDTIGLAQEHPLREEPWTIKNEADIKELEKLLLSPGRRLPVFLISQPNRKKWDYTPSTPQYMLHGQYLARKIVGYAHVVQIPYELGFAWKNRVGASWAAYDGAVRIYWPGLNFDEDPPRSHPVFFKKSIWNYQYENETGARAFQLHASQLVSSYHAKRRISWENISFVPSTRIKLADFNAEKIAKLTNIDDIKAFYKEQVDALRQKLEEAELESEQWSDEAQKEQEAREFHEEENKSLRNRIQYLSDNLTAKSGNAVDVDITLPESYDEMVEWVGEHLAGRLVLHPRAIRSLRAAQYESVALVTESLILLANEYRDYCMGKVPKVDFDEACQELYLTCSGSIAEHKAGEHGDTYFIRFPIGSQKKRFLASHLRKGTSREARHCLAIYFFWDDNTSQVVVGWLPSHLKNDLT